MFRSKKLLKAAKDYPCANCGSHGTTVSAHANRTDLGKGTGIKAHDCFTAHMCATCHDWYDGRQGRLTKEEKDELWTRSFLRTVERWFRDGVVVVK